MINKTLSERIAECKQNIIDAGLEPKYDIEFQIIEELLAENQALQTKIKTLEDLNAISYDANARLSKENQALLAKNGELLAENKIWQEMVDSTNQTNQALIKRLQENNEECVEPVSIKKETYRCAHDYVLKNQGYNNSDHLIRYYECFICGENKMTIQA